MDGAVRKTLQKVGYPAILAWPVGLGLTAMHYHWTARPGIAGLLSELALFLVSLAPVLAAVLLLERAMPIRPGPVVAREDMRTDALHLAVTWLFVGPIAQLLVQGTAKLAGGRLAHLWPSHLPLALQLVLAIVVADFGHYWFHRWAHASRTGWRIHATHHGVHQLYWFNATRFHVFEVLLQNLFQVAPLVLLGCGHETFLLYGILGSAIGWLQHANIAFDTKVINWFVLTPELHRWHHSTAPEEGNRNFAGVVMWWDLLFGSLIMPKGGFFLGTMGIADMPDFPRGYLAQQLSPFTWNRLPRIAAAPAGAGLPSGELVGALAAGGDPISEPAREEHG
jgi:sterol desaturase/sphingolipid hydroxylase (fatty acid hydroxylase superfamily)